MAKSSPIEGFCRRALFCALLVGALTGAARASELPDFGLDLPKHGIPDRVSLQQKILPGTKITYAQLDGPGCIRHLWVTPTRWFDGNRQTVIRIFFDDAKTPNVEAPVGDFFGVMLGREYYDINNAFQSVKAWAGYNCYFAMPFAKNARIEFEAGPVGNQLFLQCDWTRYPGQEMKERQRFCAQWRRESPAASYGRDYLMLDADGPGRLVGFSFGMRLLDNEDRWSHGGADNIYIDGEGEVPAYVRGIGGEDTFGASYGGVMHPVDSHLYEGVPYYAYEDTGEPKPAQRVVGYRFYGSAGIEFQRSIHLRFGSMQNDLCSTVYWYQEGAPRRFVRLPDWPQLLTGGTGAYWTPKEQVRTIVPPSDVDLPLPNSGTWQLAGVFENAGGEGIRNAVAAEANPERVKWFPYAAVHGFVDFNHLFRLREFGVGRFYEDKVAVARTVVRAKRDMEAEFRVAWDDELILRVNDEAPVALGAQTAFRPQARHIRLHEGANQIIVKQSNTRGSNHGGWAFNLRITDPDGNTLIPNASDGSPPPKQN